jgi:hypothetical protein
VIAHAREEADGFIVDLLKRETTGAHHPAARLGALMAGRGIIAGSPAGDKPGAAFAAQQQHGACRTNVTAAAARHRHRLR